MSRNLHRVLLALENYHEYKSTFTHHSQEYDLNYFLDRAQDLPERSLPLSKVEWIMQDSHPDPQRVAVADTSVPILVTIEDGLYIPIDGTHRIFKAAEERLHQIPAKFIPKQWFKDYLTRRA